MQTLAYKQITTPALIKKTVTLTCISGLLNILEYSVVIMYTVTMA